MALLDEGGLRTRWRGTSEDRRFLMALAAPCEMEPTAASGVDYARNRRSELGRTDRMAWAGPGRRWTFRRYSAGGAASCGAEAIDEAERGKE